MLYWEVKYDFSRDRFARLGFRLGEKPNMESIRAHIPESFQEVFDAGSRVYHGINEN